MALISPLTLSIVPKPIAKGGYRIHYSGAPLAGAAGHRLRLAVPDQNHSLDVTGRSSHDLIQADNLPDLLEIIQRQAMWGKTIFVRLLVMQGASVVAQSHAAPLRCPVQPLAGSISPRLLGGLGDTGPKLRYTGNGSGRMLFLPAIRGRYYFKFGGHFEVENAMRGFDCTTYVGGVLGIPFDNTSAASDGPSIANLVGAVGCNLEHKPGSVIKAYFAATPGAPRPGVFLMWSAGHVVLIVNGVVFEYSHSKNGYVETPLARWYSTPWTVRQVAITRDASWASG